MKHFHNATTGEIVGEGFAGLNDQDWREVTMAEIAAIQAAKVTPEEKRAALHLAIDAERTRRIEAGAAFPVQGMADPVRLTGRAKDQSVYLALLMRAQGAKAAGIDAPFMTLRDGDDTILALTPDQMIALIGQAMGWFEEVMVVSWAMKDLTGAFEDGLPDDWREDQYWP